MDLQILDFSEISVDKRSNNSIFLKNDVFYEENSSGKKDSLLNLLLKER